MLSEDNIEDDIPELVEEPSRNVNPKDDNLKEDEKINPSVSNKKVIRIDMIDMV